MKWRVVRLVLSSKKGRGGHKTKVEPFAIKFWSGDLREGSQTLHEVSDRWIQGSNMHFWGQELLLLASWTSFVHLFFFTKGNKGNETFQSLLLRHLEKAIECFLWMIVIIDSIRNFCPLTGGVYIDCPNKNCSISISVLSLSFSHSLHLFCCITVPSAHCLPSLPDRFTSLSYIYTLFYSTSLLAITFLSICIPLLSSLSVTSNRRYSSMMASRF